MCAENRSSSFSESASNKKPRSRKLLRLYPKVVTYLLKKYATDQPMVKNDAAILWYVQPPNMTAQQFPDNSITRSSKVADVYNESTLNDVFNKSVDASFRHSLRNFWATSSQTDLTIIAFQPIIIFHPITFGKLQQGTIRIAKPSKSYTRKR